MRRLFNTGLSTSIALILVLAGTAFGALIVFNAVQQRERAVDGAMQDLEGAAREAGSDFNELLEEGRGVLNGLTAVPAVRGNKAACSEVLTEVAGATRFRSLVRFDPRGRGLCGSGDDVSSLIVADRDYFQAARSSRDIVVSEPLLSRDDSRKIIVLAKPIQGENGFAGVLAGSFSIETATSVAALTDRFPSASITILDRFGKVIMSRAPAQGTNGALSQATLDAVLAEGRGHARISDQDQATLIGFSPLGEVVDGPFALVRIPERVVTEPARQAVMRTLAVGTLVLVLALGAVFLVLRRQVIQPVRELLTATNQLANGAYDDARALLQGGRGEVAVLRQRLHELADTLAAREQDLRATSDRLRSLVENLPQGVCVFDRAHRLVAANQAFTQHLALPRPKVQPGTDVAALMAAAALRRDQIDSSTGPTSGEWAQCVRRGEAKNQDVYAPTGHNLAMEGRPLPQGGYLVTSTDVTERKRVAETFAAFFQHAGRRDLELGPRIEKLLEIGRRHFGLPVAIGARINGPAYEVLYATSDNREKAPTPGAVLDTNNMYCATAIEKNRPIAFDHAALEGWTEHPCYRSFGVEAYIGAPLYVAGRLYGALNFHSRAPASRAFSDSDIQVLRLLAQWLGAEIERDQNDRRLAATQQQIADQRAYLQAVVDATTDAIAPIDEQGAVVSTNPAMRRIFAAEDASLTGRQLTQLLDPDDREEIAAALARVQAGREAETATEHLEALGLRANGARFPVELDLSPMHQPDRDLTLVILRDATERKQAEETKNQFVSTVSHELRTPLTSIVGSLGLVRGGAAGDLPPRAAGLTDMAYRNAERLIGLVNDILDFERLRSGRIELQPQDLDLGEQLTEAARQNAGYAEQAGCRLEVDTQDGLTVRADPSRLQQVLANLISNAAKFSPEGGHVQVTAHAKADGETAVITVRDSGPGLPENVRERLFQPFVQADPSDSRKQQKGTGLGLAITRSLLERMGGRITVESVPGDTRFHVQLLRVQTARPADAREAAENRC